MNTGDSKNDQKVVELAIAWRKSAPGSMGHDAQLPFYLVTDTEDRPVSYSAAVMNLTLGQVFGTIQRLAQRVEELELDLEIVKAKVDCVVAQQAYLNTEIGDERHTANREHWNLLAEHVRQLEAKRERLKKR
jgi:hypothetical protein